MHTAPPPFPNRPASSGRTNGMGSELCGKLVAFVQVGWARWAKPAWFLHAPATAVPDSVFDQTHLAEAEFFVEEGKTELPAPEESKTTDLPDAEDREIPF